MTNFYINPSSDLAGEVFIPGDKSISHRMMMLAPLAKGTSEIKNFQEGKDCLATLDVMRSLGAHIELDNDTWYVHGSGYESLSEAKSILNCQNSGTTMRLMAGLLCGYPFMSVLDGSYQLKSRPMDRIIEPLKMMGAKIYGRNQNTLAPLCVTPSSLNGIDYKLVQKSAQVKSAIILASLFAKSNSRVANISNTRDHTENLLISMGAQIKKQEDSVEISPLSSQLKAITINIPGDISSAAFLMVAGILCAKESLTLKNILLNQSRSGIIDALKIMGAHIEISNQKNIHGEDTGDVTIFKSELKGAEFKGDHIVRMIDEIPILALAASKAQGETLIKDAKELKVKETDRISTTAELLKKMGANIKVLDDGMLIKGPCKLNGGSYSSFFDHRMALMLAVAGLVTESSLCITNAHVMDDSFPGFKEIFSLLGANVDCR